MSQLLFRIRKEWTKERAAWSRTCDSFISTTQLVFERAQEGKRLLADSMSSTTDFEKDLEKYLSNYSSEMISLSQRPLSMTQTHKPQASSRIMSMIPFTQIHDVPNLSSHSVKGGGGTEKSEDHGHMPERPENSDYFGTQSDEKVHEQGSDERQNDDNDAMCVAYDQTHSLSTTSIQFSSLARHGTICDTYPNTASVTQVPEHPFSLAKEKIIEERENPVGDENDQLSPTIHYSGHSRKVSSSEKGSSVITPSRRNGSFLSGWIDDSLPMNKTELIHTLQGGHMGDRDGVDDCKKTLEFSCCDENHSYDVDEEEEERQEEKGNNNLKTKKLNFNDSDVSIGGMI